MIYIKNIIFPPITQLLLHKRKKPIASMRFAICLLAIDLPSLHAASGYDDFTNLDVDMSMRTKPTTELHKAAKEGKEQEILNLLNQGADIGERDNEYQTPEEVAQEAFQEASKSLLQECNKVFEAVINNQNSALKKLLDKHKEFANAKRNKQTPLHIAAEKNHLNIVDTLLDTESVNINATDRYQRTALHLAVTNNHPHMVRKLLRADGVDINATDRYQQTALHIAVKNRNLDMVNILSNTEGIDLSAKSSDGKTPLEFAKSMWVLTQYVSYWISSNDASPTDVKQAIIAALEKAASEKTETTPPMTEMKTEPITPEPSPAPQTTNPAQIATAPQITNDDNSTSDPQTTKAVQIATTPQTTNARNPASASQPTEATNQPTTPQPSQSTHPLKKGMGIIAIAGLGYVAFTFLFPKKKKKEKKKSKR